MKNIPKSQTGIKLADCWSKMPLEAPLHIRCPNKLFIYGLILFKIGGNGNWSGKISKIVELANEKTPLNQKRWTYARVDYILRWLRKEGWLYAERPARNKALVYCASRPADILPIVEKPQPLPTIEIIRARPVTLMELDQDEETKKILEEYDASFKNIKT